MTAAPLALLGGVARQSLVTGGASADGRGLSGAYAERNLPLCWPFRGVRNVAAIRVALAAKLQCPEIKLTPEPGMVCEP
jgi:hypothetical protein